MRRSALVAVSALSIALLAACAGRPPRGPAPEGQATPLLVVVVIDQLGADALALHRDALSEDGVLSRALDEGIAYRVRFEHAATLTAPGHAAIFTGEPPRESGVGNNARWDRAERRTRRIFDDGRQPIAGLPGVSASPSILTAPTLADRLRAATSGEGKVVAVSIKDRGAVPGGGLAPDALFFYEASLGRFTSSRPHPPELVDGLPLEVSDDRLAPWRPLRPTLYAERLGRDDAPGEMAEHGMGVSFPHAPGDAPAPLAAYAYTPAATEHLLELAGELAERLELGRDRVPDLLTVSISSTDYIGHQHGPRSWEYLDHLIRADLALARLVDRLGGLGRVTLAVTSDHGAAPLPESSPGGVRIDAARLAVELEAELARAFGPGPHLEGFVPPWLYLRRDEARDAKVAHLLAAAPRTEGLLAAFDARDAERLAASADPLERAVGASIPRGADFDVYLVTREGAFFGVGRGGTSHGGPHAREREVPGLLLGRGVARAAGVAPRSMRDFHATLRALLGVAEATDRPLPGLAPGVGQGVRSVTSSR